MFPRSNGCSDPMRLRCRGSRSREPGREGGKGREGRVGEGRGMASEVQNLLHNPRPWTLTLARTDPSPRRQNHTLDIRHLDPSFQMERGGGQIQGRHRGTLPSWAIRMSQAFLFQPLSSLYCNFMSLFQAAVASVKTEVRKQMSDVRNQKAECKRRNAECRMLNAESKMQAADVRLLIPRSCCSLVASRNIESGGYFYPEGVKSVMPKSYDGILNVRDVVIVQYRQLISRN